MKQIKALVKTAIVNNKFSVGILGTGGVGKSDIIKQIGRELNRHVEDVRAGYMSPGELLGNPKAKEVEFKLKDGSTKHIEVTHYTVPEWLQRVLLNPDCILVMEEISNAAPDVIGALYELLWDRKIHDIKIPDGVSIVFTGNQAKDAIGVAMDLPPTIYTRTKTITIRPSDINIDDWISWAVENNIRKDIIAFLSSNRQFLLSEQKLGQCYCTPRSWAILSDELNGLYLSEEYTDSYRSELVDRAIRESIPEAATLFTAFHKQGLLVKPPLDYIYGKEKLSRDNELFMFASYNVIDFLFDKSNKKLVDSAEFIDNFTNFINKMEDREFKCIATIVNKFPMLHGINSKLINLFAQNGKKHNLQAIGKGEF